MKKLKNIFKVTYRRSDSTGKSIPAIILEGKWLTELYGLKVGDKVFVDRWSGGIRIKKKRSKIITNKRLPEGSLSNN